MPASTVVSAVRPAAPVIRPSDEEIANAADVLNRAHAVTILAGAGCEGAHDELVAVAGRLKAPVVHAMRGKEFVEYDNPYDVGMTGLLGFASGYRAMEHCDALLMLGTDFPYPPFYPDAARIVQVDVRGENIGRRMPVDVALVGSVRDTVRAIRCARRTPRRARRRPAGCFRPSGACRGRRRDGPPGAGAAAEDLYAQARGFTLWATRSVLSGDGSTVLEVARTNLRQLVIE